MKVKTISYSESRESVNNIGLKSWKKLGMEAEVEDTDILQTSVAVLKEYVKGMILDEEELQPIDEGIKWNPNSGLVPLLPTIDYSAKEKVEKAIEDCKTPHELDLLMGDVAKYGLTKEFINKKKSLK